MDTIVVARHFNQYTLCDCDELEGLQQKYDAIFTIRFYVCRSHRLIVFIFHISKKK